MKNDDLMDATEVKKNVPGWVYSTCATLMFLSVFINSIGLNLMQINGALTTRLVNKIEGSPMGTGDNKNNNDIQDIKQKLDKVVTKEDLVELLNRIKALEGVSHSPTS
jgi:hypothetical protein